MNMKQRKRYLMGAGALLLIIYLYYNRAAFFQIAGVLLLSAAFAFMLSPLCTRMEQRKIPAAFAALLSILMMLLMIVLLASVFFPYLIANAVVFFRRMLPTLTQMASVASAFLASRGIQILPQGSFAESIATHAASLITGALHGGYSLVRYLGQIVFALVIAYYLLKERRFWLNHCLLFIPIQVRTASLTAAQACKNALLSYLSGTLKTSLFISAAMYIGLMLLGVDDAFLLALFMGVFELFPYAGPILASIPVLLVTLPEGLHRAAASLLLIIAIQQLESNLISPHFAASSVSLHPLAALISVFVFGSLMGLWGVLLAVPFVVAGKTLYSSIVQANSMRNR